MNQLSTQKGKLPIRFGWQALADFADKVGLTMDEIITSFQPQKLKPSELSEFILEGIRDGHRETDQECKVKSVEEIAEIINSMGLQSVLKETVEAFESSPFIINSTNEEPVKKK
jgi:hypothetical protein